MEQPNLMRRSIVGAALAAAASHAIGADRLPAGYAPKAGSVIANGLRFHYLEMGTGPLALCLHGFPDSPYTYRYLMPALAAAGYRVVTPFMRGYAPTDVPTDGRYDTQTLATDPNALHAALGGDGDAVLIAHDWGAAAAYGALSAAPLRWRRAIIGNVPPMPVFAQIAFDYAQLKRSFYFWFFQMGPAEAVVAGNDLAFIDGLWNDWSPGYRAAEDLQQAKACLRAPENLRAAMGYYRAFFDPARFGTADWSKEQNEALGTPVPQVTLYLHGTNDGCIALPTSAEEGVRRFLGPSSRVERIAGAGHFFFVEKPAEVNAKILRFLKNG